MTVDPSSIAHLCPRCLLAHPAPTITPEMNWHARDMAFYEVCTVAWCRSNAAFLATNASGEPVLARGIVAALG